MKKAKVEIVSVFATCPDCGGPLCGFSGSAYIVVSRYEACHEFKCGSCDGSYQLEEKAWK